MANDDTATTTEGIAVTVNVVANDTDSDGSIDPATVVIVSNPANGTVVNNGDGTVTYTPAATYTGTDSFTYTVNDNAGATSNIATVSITVNSSGGGGGSTGYTDDFSTDSTGDYVLTDTWTQGGVGQFLYDAVGQDVQVLTGDNIGLQFSHGVPAFDSGVFSIDFSPTVKYPSGGWIVIKLRQDSSNYYVIYNTDGYGAKWVHKVVNGAVVDTATFQGQYRQGNSYTISVDFSPTQTTVNAFGETLVMNTDTSAITVNSFEVEVAQQDAYFDNIYYAELTSSVPMIISMPTTIAYVGANYTYDVNAKGSPSPVYNLLSAPANMYIDSSTGLISWSPSVSDVGDHLVSVEAVNSAGSDVQSFTLTVQSSSCVNNIDHYWKLNEPSGNIFYDITGQKNASCSISCPQSVTGKIDGALQFNGKDNSVNIPSDPSFNWAGNDSFSIEFWTRGVAGQTCAGSGSVYNEVMIGRDDGQLHWWIGCANTTGNAVFRLQDNTGFGPVNSLTGPPVNDGKWHHIVGIHDGVNNVNLLYVDGQLVDTQSIAYTGDFSSQADINIGHLNNAFYYNGTIDEIAIYNRIVSDAEIQQHYYDGIVGLEKGYCGCTGNIEIMPLGDSITAGYISGLTQDYRTGYRQKLYLDLINSGYSVDFVGSLQDGSLAAPSFDIDHEGHAGWHAKGGTGGGIAPNIYSWLVANPSDVVLLHIGTNDISNGDQNATEIAEILDEIDRYEADYNKKITVVLARIISRTDGVDANGDGLDDTTFNFNNAVEQMVNARISNGDKIIIVDQEGALDYLNDMSDFIHPNQTGYDKMSVVWYNALIKFMPFCSSVP